MVCTRLGAGGHDRPIGIAVGILIMMMFVVAERIGSLLEEPLGDNVFGLPMDRFCAQLGDDLLDTAATERPIR
jgi:putative membrane protein